MRQFTRQGTLASAALLCLFLPLAAGCALTGGSADEAPEASAAAAGLAGRYSLEGVTVQAGEGRVREVSGTLELMVDADRYETTYTLETTYPAGEADAVAARIRGSGKGVVMGGRLAGITASTLELEGDGGALDLISISVSEQLSDGGLVIRLQNEPGPANEYTPSVTVLRGTRVSDR